MRLPPLLLGTCVALVLVLYFRGEEPAPIVVRERHVRGRLQGLEPATRPPDPLPLPVDRTLSAAQPPPEVPPTPDCVPGRLCATPQLPPRRSSGVAVAVASHGVAAADAPLPLDTVVAAQQPATATQTPPPRRSSGPDVPQPVSLPPQPLVVPQVPPLSPGAVMLRVRQAPGAAPMRRAAVVRGLPKAEARDFECPGLREGPFCFVCQVSCGGRRDCQAVVRACARLPHCTSAKINEGRTFGTLKTSDASYLEGVAAAAAARHKHDIESCSSEGAAAAASLDPHAAEKDELRSAFLSGQGTAYFVHIQNAGGTSMCKLAQKNGLPAPAEAPEESGVFGRNCNPGSKDAVSVWKGGVDAQVEWQHGTRYRFVANEMALPPQLAWGHFLYLIVVRHPRELALARFRGSPMYHKGFDDRLFAKFLKRGLQGGGGVHNVMTRQLCGCLHSPELAECGHGKWSEEELRPFKLHPIGEPHLECAKQVRSAPPLSVTAATLANAPTGPAPHARYPCVAAARAVLHRARDGHAARGGPAAPAGTRLARHGASAAEGQSAGRVRRAPALRRRPRRGRGVEARIQSRLAAVRPCAQALLPRHGPSTWDWEDWRREWLK